MTDLPAAVRSLAAAQDGVLAAGQLLGHLTRGQIRANLQARRWQRVGRTVVVLHNGPLTSRQQVWAVLLQAPAFSAVSGPTAMALDGAEDRWATGVHITMPCGQRTPRGLTAHVHWSNFLGDADVHPTKTPRRTRLPRSVVDWASWQTSDRAARTVVLQVLQRRHVSAAALREVLPSRGPCRFHAVILESIGDAEGGVASLPERDFRQLVINGGLPTPSHQAVRRRPSGVYYLDVEWARYRLSAEIQGSHHFELVQRELDLDRQNDLVIEGESLLQFTSFAVRHRGAVLLGTLRRALYSRGWVEGLAVA
jgi:very-short-patch-repair endonuclease